LFQATWLARTTEDSCTVLTDPDRN
jgi:hypothetical protein